jgi:hypothetical protein
LSIQFLFSSAIQLFILIKITTTKISRLHILVWWINKEIVPDTAQKKLKTIIADE